jgi:hypothetical protein
LITVLRESELFPFSPWMALHCFAQQILNWSEYLK